MTTKKQLGQKIKELRLRAGLSQEALASKVGMQRVSLSQLENGERDLTSLELLKFSDIFQISCEEILRTTEVTIEAKEIPQKTNKPGIRDSRPQITIDKSRIGKFKNILLYLLERTAGKPNVGESVLNKLLYFVDFNYYEIYEEQLIGASYIRNHHGPTPVELIKVLDTMVEKGEIDRIKTKYFNYDQIRFLPNKKPDLTEIKASEIKIIDDVIERYSDMSAKAIREYSHCDVPWLTTHEGEKIDYESVFYRTPAYSVRSYGEED